MLKSLKNSQIWSDVALKGKPLSFMILLILASVMYLLSLTVLLLVWLMYEINKVSLKLPVFEVSEFFQGHSVKLHPSVSYVLTLLILKGSLAVVFIFEEHCSFASLRAVWVLANLDLIMDFITIEEVLNVHSLHVEGQASESYSKV